MQANISLSASVPTPAQLIAAHPVPSASQTLVENARHALRAILRGEDDRLTLIIGPCSIHDPQAALDYAQRLAPMRQRFGDELEIVMRTYFAKPRTTVGWKGLLNDPHQDQSFDIGHGLQLARRLLLDITALGLPTATEYLDLVTPDYLADLVTWGAIGARTTESQVHRELASGLPCPVGFKNGTDGNVKIAIDALQATASRHHLLANDADGRLSVRQTTGNPDCHVILRGGKAPNYDALSIQAACAELERARLPQRVMIDASHGNSNKVYQNQIAVCQEIGEQIATGDARIIGVMVESNLVAGRQDRVPGNPLRYGQSITDGCIGWDETEAIIEQLAGSVRQRRATRQTEPAMLRAAGVL